MRKKHQNYIYNFLSTDDDGSHISVVHIDGVPITVGVNVVIMPGVKIVHLGSDARTTIGSNSFFGTGTEIVVGKSYPAGTIVEGQPTLSYRSFSARVRLVADDLGRKSNVNAAVQELLDRELLSNVSLMANFGKTTLEACQIIKKNQCGSMVNIHFSPTDGFPLSKRISYLVFDSTRRHNLAHSLTTKRSAIFLLPSEKRILIDEFKQQYFFLRSNGLTPTGFDSHGNVHFKLTVARALLPSLLQCGITKVRLPSEESLGHHVYDFLFRRRVRNLYRKHFPDSVPFLYTTDLLSDRVLRYKGKTFEIMCHPIFLNGHVINRRDVGFEVLFAFFRAMNIIVVR